MAKKSRPRFLTLEAIGIGIAVGAAAAAAEYRYAAFVQTMLNGVSVTVYGTMAQVMAGLFGFVVTGISIALVIAQDPKFENFRQSDNYKALWWIFRAATWPLGIAAILGFAGLFVPSNRSLFYIAVFMVVLSSFRIVHVVRTLFAMTETLAHITSEIESHNKALLTDMADDE